MKTDQSWVQRFLLNAETQLKSGSTYVIGLGLGFLWILSLWPDLAKAVDGLTGNHGYGAGIAVLVTALVTKFRPSNAMSSQLEAALLEIARIKANNLLKSHGIGQEIPPAPSAAALPQIPMQYTLAKVADATPGSIQPSWAQTAPAVHVDEQIDLPIDPTALLGLVKDYLAQQARPATA